MDEEPKKPKGPRHARSVHELRSTVKAKDKFAAVGLPESEAIALLEENYSVNTDSARAFITWLKGRGSGEPAPNTGAAPGTAIESWHHKGNLEACTEQLLSDEDSTRVRATKAQARAVRPSGATRSRKKS